MNLNDEERDQLQNRLYELRLEHSDLNDIIDRLAEDPTVDQLQLRRMKQRKLQLKDTILRLESMVIPDLDA